MKKIVFSSNGGAFRASDVLMGAWCLNNEINPFESISKFNVVPDPVSGAGLWRYSQSSIDIAEALLTIIIKGLNKSNNVHFSYEFWRIMAFPWLLTLVQTVWERKLRVDYVLEKYGDEKFSIKIIHNNINWNFTDSLDFFENGIHNTNYNDWLFSMLFDEYLPDKWNVKYYSPSSNNKNNRYSEKYYKNNIKDIIKTILRCRGVYGLNRIEESLFSFILHINPSTPSSDKKGINKPTLNEKEIPLIRFIEKITPFTIPNSILNVPEEKLIQKKESKNIKYYVIGPYLNWEDKDKYFYAKKVELGNRLILTQHGSNYGTSKSFAFPGEIEFKQSHFFSWGWDEQDEYKKNILPLPSPFLTKLTQKKKKRSNKLILAGTKEYLYPYRFSSLPQPIDRIKSFNEKKHFIQNLDSNVFSLLEYFIYPDETSSFTNSKYLIEIFPTLNIKRGNLINDIFKCRLLVLDHPGTSLNIALASNIPTICFFNNETWEVCSQAKPYFAELINANIIFNSGIEASEKVNEIWSDVNEWWGQKNVINARKLWVNKFANTNKNWKRKWLKTLWKL